MDLIYKPSPSDKIIGVIPCSVCHRDLIFTDLLGYNTALTKQVICLRCLNNPYKRLCPKCGNTLYYSSKNSLFTANKNGGTCWGCAKRKYNNDIDRRKAAYLASKKCRNKLKST